MKVKASYLIKNESGEIIENKECMVMLDSSTITLNSQFTSPLKIFYKDIISIQNHNYKIRIKIMTGDTIEIYDLGYKYEDISRELIRCRNKYILKSMLIKNSNLKTVYKADVIIKNSDVINYHDCELHIYENALIIFTKTTNPIRLLYSYMNVINKDGYKVNIFMDDKNIVLKNLGKKFDSFIKNLSEVNDKISFRTQKILNKLLPKASSLEIRKLSDYMKDGKAVSRKNILKISEELWKQFENKLDLINIKKEYDFLSSYSNKDKIHVGVKRGLMGDITGDYIWFLFPIYSLNKSEPGNAIVMEAVNTEGKSQASYFFKICKRKEYKEIDSLDKLSKQTDRLLKEINQCMLEIDFRREPIYLSDDKLQEERYNKYLFAMTLIPEIKILRDAFIGRVIHSSFKQWSEDVISLLTFNVNINDEKSKWNKK